MSEQALGERAVETFNNSLVSVNLSAPTANICFVVFHLFGHASHELAPRVNQQHLRPRQRAALVNRLTSLRNYSRVFRGQRLSFFVATGDVNNSERVFVNSAATQKLVVWQKKKVR